MRHASTERLTALLADQLGPCISLYQPTHRHHPDNQQDPIRYRNLLREMDDSLQQLFPARKRRVLLERFESLSDDDGFWNQRTDGLAIFASSEMFEIVELQRSVLELVVVADSFHVKPLLRALQSADRYQVLALSRHEARLYEGNRYALDPLETNHVPSTMVEALGEQLTDQHLTVASYGAGAARAAGGGATPSVHAHGDKKDEVDIDRDRFFRIIDRATLDHHSRPSGLPLILATLTEYHAPFREVSHNPYLMADGIQMSSDALRPEHLRAAAWRTMEPIYLHRLATTVDDYQAARSRELGSDDLLQVAEAAVGGRVGTLLVEDDRQIPGTIDHGTGEILTGDLSDPEVDDVLDDVAELVIRLKGQVIVVPAERMPSSTGAAAIYRY